MDVKQKIEIIDIVIGLASVVVSGLLIWGIQSGIKALLDCTVAIKELTTRMKVVEEAIEQTKKIPKLENDIRVVREKVRDLRLRFNFGEPKKGRV